MTDTSEITQPTREQQLLEQFKDGLDPAGAAALALRVDDLEAAVATLTNERDDAFARAETAEKASRAAKASVARSNAPAKPRKLGPIDGGLTGEALDAAIAKADAEEKPVEIVLSDGAREIAGIAPIAVTGDVWRDHALGKMLRDPVTIHGPETDGTGFAIHGYALLIDGKQVAYCQRSDVINVAPGNTVSIADDIYF